MILVWSVPVDNENTINFRFRYFREDQQTSEGVSFGQLGERSYEERQRKPGDFDAQTSQRPIAIHTLEHLASSDQGVIQFRQMVRRGNPRRAKRRGPRGHRPEKKGRSFLRTAAILSCACLQQLLRKQTRNCCVRRGGE